MVVYVEYAIAENFLLDGLILYLALKIARSRVKVWRLLLAAAVGAAEAVCFPLLSVPVWCAYLLKGLGGVLICLIAVSKGRIRTYLITVIAFFLITFAMGGALTAVYSFFDVEYAEGAGFIVERAPVSLVLAAAGIFAVFGVKCVKYFYRFGKLQRSILPCVLEHGERKVTWKGLSDSGNLLEFRGEPVCVFSSTAAFALFGKGLKEAGRITLNTVNGARETPVFVCEKMQVGKRNFENVYLAVGDISGKDYQLILHTAYTEGSYETDADTASMAQKSGGKRKRRSLSLRK